MSVEIPWRSVALDLLARQGQAVDRHVPGVLEDQDPEHLHALRVALRRTCHALRLFAPVLGRSRAILLRRRLNGTRRALGPLRELDVSIPLVRERLTELGCPPGAAVPVLSQLMIKRVLCRHEAYVHLLDTRLQADVELLGRPEAWPERRRHERALPDTALELAWELARPLHRLRKAGPYTFDVQEWHAIRIRVKRLRDALDALEPRLPPNALEAREPLKVLQGRLGTLEDLVNRVALLRQLAAEGGLPKPAQQALRALIRLDQQERSDTLRDLEALWTEHRRLWASLRPAAAEGEEA